MTFTVEVEKQLKQTLQRELTDPNNNRRGSDQDFVFTEKPGNYDKTPYILISLLDNQKEGFSIGKTDRFHRHRIQVAVRVGKDNKFDIDGDNELESQGYIKNYWAERCDEIVQDNQSDFRNLGDDIYSLLPDSSNPQTTGNLTGTVNQYSLRRRRK